MDRFLNINIFLATFCPFKPSVKLASCEKIGHDLFCRFHDYDRQTKFMYKKLKERCIWRGGGGESKFLFVTKEILVMSEPGFKG